MLVIAKSTSYSLAFAFERQSNRNIPLVGANAIVSNSQVFLLAQQRRRHPGGFRSYLIESTD
jgi:hypothetical protein